MKLTDNIETIIWEYARKKDKHFPVRASNLLLVYMYTMARNLQVSGSDLTLEQFLHHYDKDSISRYRSCGQKSLYLIELFVNKLRDISSGVVELPEETVEKIYTIKDCVDQIEQWTALLKHKLSSR